MSGGPAAPDAAGDGRRSTNGSAPGAGPGRLRVVLASANPHKAAEIRHILAGEIGDRIDLVPRPPEIPEVAETGETFEANARLKAEALSSATGLPALADDSGIEVDALGGAPGVRSARYAGEAAGDTDNVAKLLADLLAAGAVTPAQRRARFRAVVLLAFPDGREVVASGSVEGTILDRPAGDGGFGYDPVFSPDGADGRSFAELDPADKHARSHRGRALRALAVALAHDDRLATP